MSSVGKKIRAWLTGTFLRSRAYALFWKCFAAVLAFDQVTKCLVALTLPFPTYGEGYGNDPVVVVSGFFNIVHVHNEGAAWSMFSGQRLMLSVFALVCLAAMFFFRKALEIKNRDVQLPMGLLCGGIVGNLIDRIFHGFVIDFLDIKLPALDYHWPSFNIADCGICLGVFYFLLVNAVSYYKELKGKKFREHGVEDEFSGVDELSKK